MVTLDVPADVAAAVRALVDAGHYGSPGDVVRDGLSLLAEEDRLLNDAGVEDWLRGVGLPIAEATLDDPSRSLTAEDVHARFAGRRSETSE